MNGLALGSHGEVDVVPPWKHSLNSKRGHVGGLGSRAVLLCSFQPLFTSPKHPSSSG